MLNVYPTNNQHQEQTHFFTRDVNTYHHDCPFCNQQFYFTQSNFSQNASELSKSGFHQTPVITNAAICDNPVCVVCGKGTPQPLLCEEVYEYQRTLPGPCAVCGDHSFAAGIAPFNTLTLRASQFVRTTPTYMSRSVGPQSVPLLRQSYSPQVQQRNVQYEMRPPAVSKSTILQPNIGDRLVIKTPKEEYKDVKIE